MNPEKQMKENGSKTSKTMDKMLLATLLQSDVPNGPK